MNLGNGILNPGVHGRLDGALIFPAQVHQQRGDPGGGGKLEQRISADEVLKQALIAETQGQAVGDGNKSMVGDSAAFHQGGGLKAGKMNPVILYLLGALRCLRLVWLVRLMAGEVSHGVLVGGMGIVEDGLAGNHPQHLPVNPDIHFSLDQVLEIIVFPAGGGTSHKGTGQHAEAGAVGNQGMVRTGHIILPGAQIEIIRLIRRHSFLLAGDLSI